jgi:spore maturation protein CgeB
MQIALFCHSLLSDWNHGNAHFLRGISAELMRRGHVVRVFEPADASSVQNLVAEQGPNALEAFHAAYPGLFPTRYHLAHLDLEQALCGVDLVIVHEWNSSELLAKISQHRRRVGSYRLLFHDTHHRPLTHPDGLRAFDLSAFDGVLARGQAVCDLYLSSGWARRAWVWHEAADIRVFLPLRQESPPGDLVFVGNWGDEERAQEIEEFFVRPVRELGLSARAHGVRYPMRARERLAESGIVYAGWVPNFAVPKIFSFFKATVHIPRRSFSEKLPGVPTIRPFEAMACGIPLISAPWDDCEGLFRAGRDYLVARDGEEMKRHLRAVLNDPAFAEELARNGLATIRARHTCAHRILELFEICRDLGLRVDPPAPRVPRRVPA